MTLEELDALMTGYHDDAPAQMVAAALREAWAEVEHWKEQHLAGDTPFLRDRAEKAEAAIARVRAICTRADNDEFHSPYQVVEFIRDALDGEACPFCTREAQAECESTGGRCSEEDEIDAVLDDRPDLDAHEALIAGLREAWAEVEHWKEQHLAGDTPFLRDRAEKAEAAIARVRARHAPGYAAHGWSPRCAECGNSYPCDTIRDLDGEAS